MPALRRTPDRIVQQVHQCLLDSLLIDMNSQIGGHVELEMKPLGLQARRYCRHQRLDQCLAWRLTPRQRHRIGLDAREVQQIVDQQSQPLDLSHGALQHAVHHLSLPRRCLQQRFQGDSDVTQRSAELVGGVGEELAPHALLLRQPVRHRIESHPQLRQLPRSAYPDPLSQLAGPDARGHRGHVADRPHELASEQEAQHAAGGKSDQQGADRHVSHPAKGGLEVAKQQRDSHDPEDAVVLSDRLDDVETLRGGRAPVGLPARIPTGQAQADARKREEVVAGMVGGVGRAQHHAMFIQNAHDYPVLLLELRGHAFEMVLPIRALHQFHNGIADGGGPGPEVVFGPLQVELAEGDQQIGAEQPHGQRDQRQVTDQQPVADPPAQGSVSAANL